MNFSSILYVPVIVSVVVHSLCLVTEVILVDECSDDTHTVSFSDSGIHTSLHLAHEAVDSFSSLAG